MTLAFVAYEKYAVYEPARDRYLATRDPADRDTANRARSLVRYAGTGMFAAGALALGVAGVLWWRGGASGEGVAVVPVVTPEGASIGLTVLLP